MSSWRAREQARWAGSQALGQVGLAILVLLCGLTLFAGYANKQRCTGPEFDERGRSQPDYQQRSWGEVCYSDIQYLWIGRDVDRHVFPYVHGRMTEDGRLAGGSVEYPVLTGMLIWAGASSVNTDAGFLLASTLLLTPFGLLVAWLLGKLSRWRALLWAAGPPLVLYAFHNWDLPAVACSVGAVYVLHRWRGSLLRRAVLAAVLLGVGFTVKAYPALFVLPLALYVLSGGRDGAEIAPGARLRSAFLVAGAAAGTAVLVNLPFVVAGFRGWLAAFQFQADRRADVTSNSVWYWAVRPLFGSDEASYDRLVGIASPVAVLLVCALACLLGWRRYRREGTFPWLAVSAAMLVGFLLLHKVHSPQYTLWLLPMLVLVRVRWGWVVAYLLVDLAMGIGVFRWFYELRFEDGGGIHGGFAQQAVVVGVWGRAALLASLFLVFSRARSTVDGDRAAGSREIEESVSSR